MKKPQINEASSLASRREMQYICACSRHGSIIHYHPLMYNRVRKVTVTRISTQSPMNKTSDIGLIRYVSGEEDCAGALRNRYTEAKHGSVNARGVQDHDEWLLGHLCSTFTINASNFNGIST